MSKMTAIKMKTYGNQFVIQIGTTPIAQPDETVVQRVEPLRKDGVALVFSTAAKAEAFIKEHGKATAEAEAGRLKAFNVKCQAARKLRAKAATL